MNVKKTIFAVGGIGLILLLPATRLKGENVFPGQNSAPQKDSVATAKESAVKPPAVSTAKKPAVQTTSVEKKSTPAVTPAAGTKENEQLGSGDPFAYSTAGSGDYTPLSGNKNVGIITVKGIIHIDGESPRAILYIKDSDRVHYVSKDSVVRVSTGRKNGTSPAEAYIVVKDIRNDEVELIQLERPDKVIIIR